jgi:hypothetical protein
MRQTGDDVSAGQGPPPLPSPLSGNENKHFGVERQNPSPAGAMLPPVRGRWTPARSGVGDFEATVLLGCIDRCERRASRCGAEALSGERFGDRSPWIVAQLRRFASGVSRRWSGACLIASRPSPRGCGLPRTAVVALVWRLGGFFSEQIFVRSALGELRRRGSLRFLSLRWRRPRLAVGGPRALSAAIAAAAAPLVGL